jgi:hypothetical protein
LPEGTLDFDGLAIGRRPGHGSPITLGVHGHLLAGWRFLPMPNSYAVSVANPSLFLPENQLSGCDCCDRKGGRVV